MTSCARCRTEIDPTRAAMSGDGLICPGCEQRENTRDASFSAPSGLGPLGWGLISLACNPLMIPSILAITGGLSELKVIKAERETGGDDPALSSRHTNAIAGIVLGAFGPLMLVVVMGFVGLMMIGAAVAGPSSYDDPYAYEPYEYPSYDDTYEPYGSYGGGGAANVEDVGRGGGADYTVDPTRPIAGQLDEHAAIARALQLRPYVYLHADWCSPCQAIARNRSDPAMVEAYEGAYIIEIDIDEVSQDQLDSLGYEIGGIPAWYGVDTNGRFDGRLITGAAWGENIPANMAPPLRTFFAGG